MTIHQCLFSEEKAITVRLVGTNVSHVGQVEIQYNGAWGAVCHGYWDIQDAHVICRMLGYKAAERAISWIEGETTTRILMNLVGCIGKEKSIAECAHYGWWNVGSYCSWIVKKSDRNLLVALSVPLIVQFVISIWRNLASEKL